MFLTLLLDLMLSRCTAVASPIALCPQSSLPIVAYVADIIAIGKKYVSIIKQTLYLQLETQQQQQQVVNYQKRRDIEY